MTIQDQNIFDPTETELLGIIKHVQGDKATSLFCRIQPVFRQSNGSWVPIANPASIFPDIGLVFWWRPNADVSKGSAVRVLVEESHSQKGHRHDRYQVKIGSVASPIEISDLPEDFDVAAVRRKIAASTLSTFLPPLGRVLLALPGSPPRWIGPFEARSEDENILTCDASSGFVRIYDIRADDIQTVTLDGGDHQVFRPGMDLPAPVGYFNVQTDADLIKALANLVRRESNATDAYLLRKRVIDECVAMLSAEGGGSRDQARDGARLEAARALRADLEANEQEIVEIDRLLESLPFAQRVRDQVSAVSKAQAEQAISETRSALETLISSAVGTIAEHEVIRRLLDIGKKGSLEQRDALRYTPPPALGTLDEVSDHLTSIANSRGEDSYVLAAGAAIMAGSQLAFIAGLRAVSLATTAAMSLGGGGSCIVPVAPTMFSLADLLNAPSAPIDGLPCYAGSLGDFLIQAMKQDHVSVVILQGVNRAPPENVLLELADSSLGESYDRHVRWRNSAGEISEVLLDGRVLFLATLTRGSSTFQVPVELGIRLPLIWADRRVMPKKESSRLTFPKFSVPFDVWQATKKYKCKSRSLILEKLLTLPDYATFETAISKYLDIVSGMIGSDEVGIAEATWALTCGRCDNETLSGIVGLFSPDQARYFRAAMDSGESTRVGSYFERGKAR